MKKSLLIALFLFSSMVLAANSGYKGKVVDESASPLSGVTVTLNNGTLSDITGSDGSFTLSSTGAIINGSISNTAINSISYANGKVNFYVSKDNSFVDIAVYNLNGQLCQSVISQKHSIGNYNYSVANNNLSKGLYILRIKIGTEKYSLKLLSNGISTISQRSVVNGGVTGGVTGYVGRSRGEDTITFSLSGYETKDTIVTHSANSTDSIYVVLKASSTLPSSFTKRAVMEEATGYWCGYCPYGALAMKDFTTQYGDKFIGVAIHTGDVSSTTKGNTIMSTVGIGTDGVPDANICRTGSVYPSSAGSNISSELAKTAKCGLNIDATVDGKVTVKAGFLQDVSGAKLTVYMIENKIPDSGDYSQQDKDSVKWTGYTNDHVLTEVLTAAMGDDIDGSAGGVVEKTYSYDSSKLVTGSTANAEIIAIINTSSYIENAQEVSIGSKKDYND